MDETAIENALVTWVATATGLSASDPSAKIVWALQNQPRPDTPWISMNWHISEQVGQAGLHYTTDPSSNGHDGHEVVATASGLLRDRVSIQCFATDATGSNSARAILKKIVAARFLPAVASALRAAGIGVLKFGAITAVGGLVNAVYQEPRAQLEVTIALVNEVAAPDTVIDTVNVGVAVKDADGTTELSLGFTATA